MLNRVITNYLLHTVFAVGSVSDDYIQHLIGASKDLIVCTFSEY